MDKYHQLHSSIVNPYEHLYPQYPPYTVEKDAQPFVQASIAQKQVAGALAAQGQEYRVDDDRIQQLHDFLLRGYHEHYHETDDAAFEEQFWAEFEPIARTHNALIDFIFTKGDDRSRTYGRWVIDVVKEGNYAKAMMVVVGQGYDWLGRPCEITEDDNFTEGITSDWTLVEARWRQMKTRSAMMSAENVMIIGAGYLPELSNKYGGRLPPDQRILACDLDERIPRAEIEKANPGLTYLSGDGLSVLQNPMNTARFDVVSLPGVMSYNIDEFDAYIKAAMSCLRPGGVLLFDLQLKHLGMAYIGLMLDWAANSSKPIKLLERGEALALVEHAAKLCGITDWGYSSSGRYADPTTLLFEFHK